MHYLKRNVPIPFGRGCPQVIGKSFWSIPNTEHGIINWMTPYILSILGKKECEPNVSHKIAIQSKLIKPFHKLYRQPLFHQIKLNASILRNTCRQQLCKFKNQWYELQSIPIRITNIRQSNRQSQFLDKPDLINYS